MKRYAALVASAVLFSGAAVFAGGPNLFGAQQGGPPFPPGPPFGPPMIERLTRDLNLTDDQKSQVKQILDAERVVIEPLLQQLGASRKQLDDATADGQFNEEQVRAIATQQVQTMVQLTVENERVKAKIYSILTPEQREQAKALRARFNHAGNRPNSGGQVPLSN